MGSYQESSMASIFPNRVRELGNKACVAYKNAQGAYVDNAWNSMNEMVRNRHNISSPRG